MPFFTPGTVILTPSGERPVEDLRLGDEVVTRDHGNRAIRWIGQRVLDYAFLNANAHLRPVLFQQASIAPGLPERDTMVSPNHRVLIESSRTALYFSGSEALVAAKHVVNARSIRQVDVLGVTYVHFMCDQHEVVMANGIWVECFNTGDLSLGAVGNAQRGEVFEIFPDLKAEISPAVAERARNRARSILLDADN
jgi:Hint domain